MMKNAHVVMKMQCKFNLNLATVCMHLCITLPKLKKYISYNDYHIMRKNYPLLSYEYLFYITITMLQNFLYIIHTSYILYTAYYIQSSPERVWLLINLQLLHRAEYKVWTCNEQIMS